MAREITNRAKTIARIEYIDTDGRRCYQSILMDGRIGLRAGKHYRTRWWRSQRIGTGVAVRESTECEAKAEKWRAELRQFLSPDRPERIVDMLGFYQPPPPVGSVTRKAAA